MSGISTRMKMKVHWATNETKVVYLEFVRSLPADSTRLSSNMTLTPFPGLTFLNPDCISVFNARGPDCLPCYRHRKPLFCSQTTGKRQRFCNLGTGGAGQPWGEAAALLLLSGCYALTFSRTFEDGIDRPPLSALHP